MIRFPNPGLDAREAFKGTALDDWLPASHVYEALQMSARQHGEREALTFVSGGEPDAPWRHISYPALLDGVTRCANALAALGVGRGDVVAYLLPSLPETQFVLWGAETVGIAFPINPLLTAEHIAELASAARVKVLVALGPTPGADFWEKALQVRARVPSIQALVRVGGTAPTPSEGLDLGALMRQARAQPGFGPASADDTAALYHTGGTTGAPKIVRHTHRNQLAAAYGGAFAVGIEPQDALLNGLPMFHVAATMFGSLSLLLAGARIVLLSAAGFRNPSIVRNFWRIAQVSEATLVGGVPTALAGALQVPVGDADLSRLRANLCGAALTPRAVAQGVEAATGQPLREIYGMTECAGVICVDPISRPRVLGSAGLPIAFCDVQARSLQADGGVGGPCTAGELGVLVVRGPNVAPGYVNPAHNAGLFTADGWLVTGDTGVVDASGRVTVSGRTKDLIIRSGHNIDPALVEDCMRTHPAVADAAAVGMPDPTAGEVPAVFVVLKPGQVVDEEALRAHGMRTIAEPPAKPRRVFVVDTLPLTAVGKVYKPALRAEAARRHLVEVLAGEGLGVAVFGEPPRGITVQLCAEAGAAPDAAQRRRVADKLAPYTVAVTWRQSIGDEALH
ncbi:AMP-binding protein [Acidovorax sp.]|uniref:AMP-binding protein n=1 Tax=Acidovorax sp. TaxID=1872122 RepID=UPI0026252609|nr:AMP-binding protein [Acidovorax sp.]